MSMNKEDLAAAKQRDERLFSYWLSVASALPPALKKAVVIDLVARYSRANPKAEVPAVTALDLAKYLDTKVTTYAP